MKPYTRRLKTASVYMHRFHPIYSIASLSQGIMCFAYIIAGIVIWEMQIVVVGAIFIVLNSYLTRRLELPMVERWMNSKETL